MNSRIIYLDHAATGWPKPEGVLQAAIEFQEELGVAASRGAYRRAERTDRLVDEVRHRLANKIHASTSHQIAWTSNGTMAIHAAIHSCLWQADLSSVHVVTTAIEHNSVLRTLADLEQRRGLQWTMVPCDANGFVSPKLIRQAVRADTKLVIVNHASNVTGAVQDLAGIQQAVSESGAFYMVDGAQTLGYLEVDVQSLGIDLLVGPSHKGLCGVLGCAFVCASPRMLPQLRSPWIGGTGRSSDAIEGPFEWRESIESGNLNTPAIAALGAGLGYLAANPPHDFQGKYQVWIGRLTQAILEEPDLKLIGYSGEIAKGTRVPVLSLIHASLTSHEMAMLLDTSLGVECRSGLHCAAAIHPWIGSDPVHGTLRMSLGHTTTETDIEKGIEAIRLLGTIGI